MRLHQVDGLGLLQGKVDAVAVWLIKVLITIARRSVPNAAKARESKLTLRYYSREVVADLMGPFTVDGRDFGNVSVFCELCMDS